MKMISLCAERASTEIEPPYNRSIIECAYMLHLDGRVLHRRGVFCFFAQASPGRLSMGDRVLGEELPDHYHSSRLDQKTFDARLLELIQVKTNGFCAGPPLGRQGYALCYQKIGFWGIFIESYSQVREITNTTTNAGVSATNIL